MLPNKTRKAAKKHLLPQEGKLVCTIHFMSFNDCLLLYFVGVGVVFAIVFAFIDVFVVVVSVIVITYRLGHGVPSLTLWKSGCMARMPSQSSPCSRNCAAMFVYMQESFAHSCTCRRVEENHVLQAVHMMKYKLDGTDACAI